MHITIAASCTLDAFVRHLPKSINPMVKFLMTILRKGIELDQASELLLEHAIKLKSAAIALSVIIKATATQPLYISNEEKNKIQDISFEYFNRSNKTDLHLSSIYIFIGWILNAGFFSLDSEQVKNNLPKKLMEKCTT